MLVIQARLAPWQGLSHQETTLHAEKISYPILQF